MAQLSGTTVTTIYRDKQIQFFVNDRHDLIQGHHFNGLFYEIEELVIIERYFPRGGVFLDVGANVGNHAIFVGKFFSPAQVILIEPNPPTIDILRRNVDLNALTDIVDSSLLGIGLTDLNGWATSDTPLGNLGGTRLIQASEDTGIRLAQGDDLLADRRVDFIKMDVEGMELSALRGLKAVIESNRPTMFIEVDNINSSKFFSYLQEIGYAPEDCYRRYPANQNFLVVPLEKSIMNGHTPLSLVAAQDTFIKMSKQQSFELPDSKKLRIDRGDTLFCDGVTPSGDHLKLTGVRLDDDPLPDVEWFIFRPAWEGTRTLKMASNKSLLSNALRGTADSPELRWS